MTQVLRAVGGVVVGVVVTLVLVVAVEMFSNVVHPLPPDFGNTYEEMCRHVENYPAWVLAVVVPLWAATAFAGAWIAGRIGNRFGAAVVGLLTLAALVMNLAMVPYPLWFKIACLVAVPAGSVFAVLRSGGRAAQIGASA